MTFNYTMMCTWPIVAVLVFGVPLARATTTHLAADASAHERTVLPQVTVDAQVPIPPLWRATRDGRTLLLLGTVAPVPHDLQWRSSRLKRMLAGVGAIVMPPRAKLKLGFFARVAAVASAPGKTSYPDGKTLADTLPDTVYQDVLLANRKFNHGDAALLHYRPGFAAYMLQKGMLRSMHLDSESPLYGYLRRLGHRHEALIVKPVYSVKVARPRDFVRHITGEEPTDVACLSTLAHLLAHRSGELNVRARAWADGDSSGVRAADIKAFSICNASLQPKQDLARHGVADLPGHLRATWIAAIAGATRDHRLSVAVLPMDMLFGPGGYLAALRKHGFVLSGPTFEKAASESGVNAFAKGMSSRRRSL